MFEPVLDHNRQEYARLQRKQSAFLVGSLAAAIPLVVLIALFAVDYAEPISYSYLILGFVVQGFFEIKKTIVFRRDLIEQRDHGQTDQPKA